MHSSGRPALLLLLALAAPAAGASIESTPDRQSDPAPAWALTPLRKPAVPGGADHPIDAFIRAKLTSRDLASASLADPRTLIRRLTYDLTGLPPTSDEVKAFASDPHPRAYDQLVDRLLASPRYGERWARHWLDVANYADTHGNDHDYARSNAWPYRDYVIRAFNEDKPYARFIREQVAGDALYPDDPQATIALGFVAAGPWDHTLMVTVRADTVDHRQAQVLDRDNMLSTVMGTFQSLTVHCARCHDHKFDPITQREYYRLQAVFAGVDRADRPVDANPATQAVRRRLRAEQRAIQTRAKSLLASLESPAITRQVADWEEAQAGRSAAWTTLDVLTMASAGGAQLARETDGSWFVSGERPARDTYIITARRAAGRLSALRLEALPDDRLPQRGPGRWDNGNFHLSEIRAFATTKTGEGARPLVFTRAAADYDEAPVISAAQAIDGKGETHWGIHPRYGEAHEAVFELKEPVMLPDGATLTILLEFQAKAPGHGIGRFRLTATDDRSAVERKPALAALRALQSVPVGERTSAQRQELALGVLKAANEAALAALPGPQMVYAVASDFPPDGENFKPALGPRPIHVLRRGDLNQLGEEVGPGTLGCIPGMPAELVIPNEQVNDESARRAALARWLADERNVLTWRSIVNRVWAWHFGRGLVNTPSDFGQMGETPSHPELLDWLAVWFRDDAKGSFKRLHRLIVTSETWRQSSLARQGTGVDTDNRLLWRQHRRRLTAEEVRDTALALSGRLDLTIGGPPAIQFISKGDATFNAGGNPAFLDYENFDQDSPAAGRRAIYRFVFRTVPDPFMDALDCPDGGSFTPVRGAATTAQQAFAMLNDAFLIRQSQHIADRLAARTNVPTGQADAAFRLLLLREPSSDEQTRLAGFIQKHGLANACQLLLNTSEFLYLD